MFGGNSPRITVHIDSPEYFVNECFARGFAPRPSRVEEPSYYSLFRISLIKDYV